VGLLANGLLLLYFLKHRLNSVIKSLILIITKSRKKIDVQIKVVEIC